MKCRLESAFGDHQRLSGVDEGSGDPVGPLDRGHGRAVAGSDSGERVALFDDVAGGFGLWLGFRLHHGGFGFRLGGDGFRGLGAFDRLARRAFHLLGWGSGRDLGAERIRVGRWLLVFRDDGQIIGGRLSAAARLAPFRRVIGPLFAVSSLAVEGACAERVVGSRRSRIGAAVQHENQGA